MFASMKHWTIFVGIGLLISGLFSCAGETAATYNEELIGKWVASGSTYPVRGFSLLADGAAGPLHSDMRIYDRWRQAGDWLVLSGKIVSGGDIRDFVDSFRIVSISGQSLMLQPPSGQVINYIRVDEIAVPPTEE